MFSYNTEGVKMGEKFTPVPIAVYSLQIVKTTEKTTKNGDPMISVECEIDDAGEYLGRKVWHNVTFLPKDRKGAGMALEFLKAISQPFEGQLDIDSEKWIGKTFKAKVGIEKDLKGKDHNAISYLIDKESTEDVPF